MLQGYSAHCKAGFADLKMAYARSSRAALWSSSPKCFPCQERKAHAALRKGWAAATGSLGEMASKVVDGNILAHLAAHDLRSSDPMRQMNATAKMSFCAGDVEPAMQLAAIAMGKGLFGQTARQLAMLFGDAWHQDHVARAARVQAPTLKPQTNPNGSSLSELFQVTSLQRCYKILYKSI